MAEVLSAPRRAATAEERPPSPYLVRTITYVVAILFALAVGAIALVALGANPISAYGTVLDNSVGSTTALAQTLNKMTPLLLGSVAVSLGMRGGVLNLGVDGQIYVGAIVAMFLALGVGGAPMPVAIGLPLLGAMVGGALFGAIPAFLRYRWSVNELFVTVMLNFVGIYLADWLATRVWGDPVTGLAISKPIPISTQLPGYGHGGHIGIVIAFAFAIGVQLWLRKSRRGFELNVTSINPIASRMAGISRLMVVVIALAGGGALAGLAGGIELTGAQFVLFNGLSPNYGYMSVLAAVLARRSPVMCVPTTFGLAVLLVGMNALQASISVPSSAVLMLEGLVVLTILLGEVVGGSRTVQRAFSGPRRHSP